MSKKRRMQYIGASRDVKYNPWIRLVHGKHYQIEKSVTKSGKVRIRIFDDIDVARESYDSESLFRKEWC